MSEPCISIFVLEKAYQLLPGDCIHENINSFFKASGTSIGGPVVKTTLPLQARPLVRKLRSYVPNGAAPKIKERRKIHYLFTDISRIFGQYHAEIQTYYVYFKSLIVPRTKQRALNRFYLSLVKNFKNFLSEAKLIYLQVREFTSVNKFTAQFTEGKTWWFLKCQKWSFLVILLKTYPLDSTKSVQHLPIFKVVYCHWSGRMPQLR